MENLNLTPTPLDTSLASASNSSSTADGNIINHECDVFINHRAHEVGKTLASHLSHSLLSHGLRVFLETEEMQRGDGITSQIEGAIRTALVQIAIFSPCYAESARCLDELVLMWQTGAMILPVFYKTHLEYPTYADTKRMDALARATDINGFVLEDCNNDEGKLVKNIVERVLKMLKNHLCYDVFLNHRGPDVKKGLASHIYYALIAHGLRVFLDIEELRQGNRKGYWNNLRPHSNFLSQLCRIYRCLEELVLMFQSRKTIIPVFTGVTPSDLMSENLCVLREKKTKEEKPRYDNETLAKWRDCLSQIALATGKRHSDRKEEQVLSGFDLGECEGDEGKLVDQVVKRVLQEEARRF